METPNKRILWVALAGAFTAAVLFALACPPYGYSVAAWLVPGVLLLSARRLPVRHAFEAGLLFGILSAGLVHRWLPGFIEPGLMALGVEGSPLLTSLIAFAGIAVGVGVPCGAMTAAYAIVSRQVSRVDLPIAGAFLWVACEWLRAQTFGWQLLGHTQFRELWLIQVADLGGVLAVSFVVAFASIAAAEVANGVATRGMRITTGARALVLPVATLVVALGHGVGARMMYEMQAADAHSSHINPYAADFAEIRPASWSASPRAHVRPELQVRQVALVEHAGLRVSPLLCEDLFDASIVHGVVAAGADVLINSCRVGWLTDAPAAAEQHLAQAVIRAVESRRFLVRATEDGEAELITATGEVHRETPRGQTFSISTDTTRYMQLGDRWIFVGLGVSLIVVGRGKRPRD